MKAFYLKHCPNYIINLISSQCSLLLPILYDKQRWYINKNKRFKTINTDHTSFVHNTQGQSEIRI